MIEIIGGIMMIIGIILLIVSFKLITARDNYLFIVIEIIGGVILIIGFILLLAPTAECRAECTNQDLEFSHQEYNQCSDELTCYCKQPITQPKPKVVIIE